MKPSDSKHSRKKHNPHKPRSDVKSYVKFMAVALVLLITINYFQGERPYVQKMKDQYYAEQAEKEARYQEAMEKLLPPRVVFPDDGAEYFEAPVESEEEKPELQSFVIKKEPLQLTKIQDPSATLGMTTQNKPKIAIVIDDVGMNLTQSRAAINLDPHVTLAFLPYAETVRSLAQQAKDKGHEIIIHAPMEAMDSHMNLGGLALRASMSADDFHQEFQKIADSFEGYTGVNNHMGSKLTQDPAAMKKLMGELKARGLYFLDSKTIATSIAADIANQYGVPFAVRDVFLDHEEDAAYVAKALAKTESIARTLGIAIAIGHPKKNTMAALQKWIPTLEAKGFELVPLGEMVE
ncbi:MAG: divergent polysaccharide deacetylase family protein [Alphaproteobacteria bacterium]